MGNKIGPLLRFQDDVEVAAERGSMTVSLNVVDEVTEGDFVARSDTDDGAWCNNAWFSLRHVLWPSSCESVRADAVTLGGAE